MQVRIFHSLLPSEAKERISKFLEEKYRENEKMISNYDVRWSGYLCHLIGSVKNISIQGKVKILEGAVEVELNIPLVFYAFKSKIKKVITTELSKILD